METSRFTNFILHSWVNFRKFKGASALCAILINLFLLIFKLTFCAVILTFTAPFLLANTLLNKPVRGILNRVLYALLVLIGLVFSMPLIVIPAVWTVEACQLMLESFTQPALAGSAVISLLVSSFVSYWAIKLFTHLMSTLFCRDTIAEETVPRVACAEGVCDVVYDEEEDETSSEELVQEEEREPEEVEDDIEDLHFCQLFRLGKDMCLMVDHIEMCPDETAFIRVVDDEGYTPLYKRKVRRDKIGKRFIVFNSANYYLDDNKTKPMIPKK